MVLLALAEDPTAWRHGYDLCQQTGLKAGTLYPILHKLESDGFVRAEWEEGTARPRKWYVLTAAGKKRLKERVGEWQVFVNCVQRVLGPSGLASPQPA